MEIIALVIFIAIVWVSFAIKNSELADESNITTVYIDQMKDVVVMSGGPVEVALIRQSGNLYRDLGVFHDASVAVDEVIKSFKRAKVDAVRISVNTQSEFKASRLFHNHRGSSEGKKLGGVIIRSLS